MVKRKEKKKYVSKQKLIDEQSLYYIIERDLDREAIFKHHDGWYSQVTFGKGKRIDYVVRYRDKIYGIEVKKDFPDSRHFEQAERYRSFLDGIFLAYPADGVGQAVYVSELKETRYPDIGLISLTLFRSHIIRKTKQIERQHEQIWKDLMFDDKEYLKNILNWKREPLDRLSESVLEDGCFWVSFNRNYKKGAELSKLSFCETDWKGLAVLYGATFSTSLHRFFSIDDLYENYCRDIGWKSFRLEKLEMCGLVLSRGYGNLASMWTLSEASFFFINKIRKALKWYLGKTEWKKLEEKISQWRHRHEEKQEEYRKEFVETI